jgi:hypothetical protein
MQFDCNPFENHVAPRSNLYRSRDVMYQPKNSLLRTNNTELEEGEIPNCLSNRRVCRG